MPLKFTTKPSTRGIGDDIVIWEENPAEPNASNKGDIVITWHPVLGEVCETQPQIHVYTDGWGLFQRKPLTNALELIASKPGTIGVETVHRFLKAAGLEYVES